MDSISGFRPLPGGGPPHDNVYSFQTVDSADHREVRTAPLSPPAVPLGQALDFFSFYFFIFMESNLPSRVAEFEAGYFLPFFFFFFSFFFSVKPALSPFFCRASQVWRLVLV